NPPDIGIGMTFTSVNDSAYRVGGYSGYVDNKSLGSATNLLWQLLLNGPTLIYHSACYMSDYNIIVYFGGQSGAQGPVNGVYIFDLISQNWNLNPNVANSPTPRKGHSAVCLGSTMIMYGGGVSAPSDDSVWQLKANSPSDFTWSTVKTTNKVIGARMGHSAVLYNNTMIIFGGIAIGQNDPNVHMLDLNTLNWTNDSKTNFVVAIVAGIIGGLLFILVGIAAVIIIYRRCFSDKSGKFESAIARRRRRTRDVSYYSTDDPNIDIMTGRTSGDARREAPIPDLHTPTDVLIPTPATARVANKDIILNAPTLFNNNDKSRLSSGDNGTGIGTSTRLSQYSSKNIPEEEEAEVWTFASSLGFDQQTARTPPIRYMSSNRGHMGSEVPLALPVPPPDVTAPRVPPVSVPVSPTLPSGYASSSGMMNSNPATGRPSTLPQPQVPGNPADALSPLDRIARLFSGGDVTGSIVRSEKEGNHYHSSVNQSHQYNQLPPQPPSHSQFPSSSEDNPTITHQTGSAQEGRTTDTTTTNTTTTLEAGGGNND
ncbi:4131_t:CDS:2, partial [Ambispora leptoticha]